jgi:hypothetical protein
MTAFLAKMLTLLGVVLYAGGPIDAVTLISAGGELAPSQEPACGSLCPEESVAAFFPDTDVRQTAAMPLSGLAQARLIDNNETQKDAIPFIEIGLRAGIGLEQ